MTCTRTVDLYADGVHYMEQEVIDILWTSSQSHCHSLFLFSEMKFYSILVMCDVCNEFMNICKN